MINETALRGLLITLIQDVNLHSPDYRKMLYEQMLYEQLDDVFEEAKKETKK